MSGLEVVGVGIAVPGFLELCLKYGARLIARCHDFKNAETELQEALLCIENAWRAMQAQIELLRDNWDELPGDVQVHESSILAVVQSKIQLALVKIDELHKTRGSDATLKSLKQRPGHIKRAKYAATSKSSLQDVIDEMEKWNSRLMISCSVLSLVPSAALDSSLTQISRRDPVLIQMRNIRKAQQVEHVSTDRTGSIFINARRVAPLEDSGIPFSDAHIAVLTSDDAAQQIVLVDNAPHSMSKRDVRNLAQRFMDINPSVIPLLACQGVLEVPSMGKEKDVLHYQFAFKISEALTKPRSLRSILVDQSQTSSVTERIRLANSLARSLLFLHEARFVHKNIRPETLILFKGVSYDSSIGSPFLIGFEEIRSEDAHTALKGDAVKERNIYRHPQRQGLSLQEEYRFQHDIYSLGVCLLEIGLWTSFVTYGVSESPEVIADFSKKAYELKRYLVQLAEGLPSRMGDIYASVVISCLTCLDTDSKTFGDMDEYTDEDGIIIGVRYIEKVIQMLEQIVI